MTGEEINSACVFEIRQGVNVSTGNRSLVNILQQKWREHTPTRRSYCKEQTLLLCFLVFVDDTPSATCPTVLKEIVFLSSSFF